MEVYAVDLRNHGLSPWSGEWNFEAMSEDILELIEDNRMQEVTLLGHSLGGKAGMRFALDHSNRLSKLVVCDIAPKKYPAHHHTVLQGLNSVDLTKIASRKEAEEQLSGFITDPSIRQFLLKNLYRKENGQFGWRFNLKVLAEKYDEVNEEISGEPVNLPAAFMRGSKSDYILDTDMPAIKKLFPNSELITIEGAGHWPHADKPKEFLEEVVKFLSTTNYE